MAGLPYTYWRVCDACGTVSEVPSSDGSAFHCDKCGSLAGWEFTTRDKAEQHSRDILGRHSVKS